MGDKVSQKPYIGTRDFFPEETRLRRWLFGIQRDVCCRYSYEEYGAPLLEPLDLYRLKSSQEILSEQVYSFKDRGEREVAIRPEMTPTLARMVSLRQREIPMPIRWFSIANFMRYERPGHGRLREFFQLNVDLLGAAGAAANAEILMLALDILKAYGAGSQEFQVRYSDRRLLQSYLDLSQTSERLRQLSRLIDKRSKLKQDDFEKLLKESCSAKEEKEIWQFFTIRKESLAELANSGRIDRQAAEELIELEAILQEHSCGDALFFDPALIRGFDYYTGFIFEIYDNHPQNNRSIFGGGRYDQLIGLFGGQPIPAVGFGLGDVTLENFLQSYGRIPSHLKEPRGAFLVLMAEGLRSECFRLAAELRRNGIEVEQVLQPTSKLSRQFELAQKKNRRFVIILGEEELQSARVSVKDLNTGKQQSLGREQLIEYLSVGK